MNVLEKGKRITMGDGRSLTVISFIASGGQGEVYKVKVYPEGRVMALKWYTDRRVIDNPGFMSSLRYSCTQEAPSKAFIWPRYLTDIVDGSYGYVMPLMPVGYHALGEFFCIDRHNIYFHTVSAQINAALRIADAFSRLHKAGFSYQDVNDGNFLINPVTGDVLICDNDNITPDGYNNGIVGKPHYMAPEVISGRIPTAASDRLSLAIILYRLFMVDHPFEGKNTASPRYACMTPADESRLFGIDAIFCHDPVDSSNRPLPDRHPNSDFFWPMMPKLLRDTFCRALSHKAITVPSERVKASEWKQVLITVRANMVTCRGAAGDPLHDFYSEETLPKYCPRCGEACDSGVLLHFKDGPDYRLTVGKYLFLGETFLPVGYCRQGVGYGGEKTIFLDNQSSVPWRVRTSAGTISTVAPGTSVQLMPEMQILFGKHRAKVQI